MLFKIVLIGVMFFAGCGREFCKRRMEIVPGMYWEYHAPLLEYHAPRHSRIVSDKHGIIVEGEVHQVHMTFHEYGFDVSGCGKSGEAEVSGKLGWLPWADRYGIFLVAPGFKDDRYWEPQAWSSKALLSALAEIRKSYDIDTDHLLYYGYSAGVLRSPAKRGENALILGVRKRLFESHCATDESGKVR